VEYLTHGLLGGAVREPESGRQRPHRRPHVPAGCFQLLAGRREDRRPLAALAQTAPLLRRHPRVGPQLGQLRLGRPRVLRIIAEQVHEFLRGDESSLVLQPSDRHLDPLARLVPRDAPPDRLACDAGLAGQPGQAGRRLAPARPGLRPLAARVQAVEPGDALAEGHAVAPSRTISAARSGEMSPFATQYPSSAFWPQHSTRTATSFGRISSAARRAAASASNTPASSHWLTRCASPLDSHARAVPITSPPCAQSP